MQTVDDLDADCEQFAGPVLEQKTGFFDRLQRRQGLVLIITVILAFGARAYRLDAAGLAEDEANKILAVRCYQQGDFSVNTDHPMVMKMLCFATLGAADFWNRTAGPPSGLIISEESALRMPNVVFGALTVVPLFFFVTAILGFRVGLITSLLWALGLNAIWFNRVAKEDTLLIFFVMIGFYLYHLAKRRPARDVSGKERLYALSGAAFGLMAASKYLIYHYAFMVLFYRLVSNDSRTNRPLTGRMKSRHFAAMLLTFMVFNFAIVLPGTWRHVLKYVSEDLITHHGYAMMGSVFAINIANTPDLSTWFFYLLYLAIKLPLPVLVAFLVGVVEIFRHRGAPEVARGYLLLRLVLVFWLLPMSLVGSKFLRYTMGLMPFIYIVAAIGVVATWQVLAGAIKKMSGKRWRFQLQEERLSHTASAVVVATIFVVLPSAISVANLPYPSLYVNAFGGQRVGYYFPHDEFYDLGARESLKYIADHAPPGARVASEIPGVLQYYFERYGRTDLRSEIMSHPKFDFSADPPDYVLVQRGRVYFENIDDIKLIQSRFQPAQASVYQGAAAAEVYLTGAAGERASQ